MKNYGYLSTDSARKIKSFIRKTSRESNLRGGHRRFPNTHIRGFWAVIMGQTTDRILNLNNGREALPQFAYKWLPVGEWKPSNQFQVLNVTNMPGNNESFPFNFFVDANLPKFKTFDGNFILDNNNVILQNNYAVESRWWSCWVPTGEVVWLEPSIRENFYEFSYNPGIKHGIITSDIPASEIDENDRRIGIVYGKGKANMYFNDMNFLKNMSIEGELHLVDDLDTETKVREFDVYNPYRTKIEASIDKPKIVQLSWGDYGCWYISGVEC